MKRWLSFLLLGFAWLVQASELSATSPALIIVVGAGGDEEFAKPFAEWAERWQTAAQKGGVPAFRIGSAVAATAADSDKAEDKAALKQRLELIPKESLAPLWIVLIGHGTFDGREAKFNLRGPDLSPGELGQWLESFKRPVVLANCASASAPFLTELSGPHRVIVSATRSGHELNYARFGDYFSKAIGSLEADLDQDGQTSLLEAYLVASKQVDEFYKANGRMATEHPLLDDNADKQGTPADWFQGVRAVKKPAGGNVADGLRAHQLALISGELEKNITPEARQLRDQLELKIAKLRDEKTTLPEAEYYQKLEALLLELAKIYGK